MHAYSQAWDLEAGLSIPDRGRQVEILAGMTASYEQLGRNRDSAAAFDRIQALAAEPSSNPSQQAFVFNSMGTVRLAERRLPEAEEVLKRGVALAEEAAVPTDPALPYLLSNLGLALYGRKEYREAAPLFARSIDLVDRGARVAPREFRNCSETMLPACRRPARNRTRANWRPGLRLWSAISPAIPSAAER